MNRISGGEAIARMLLNEGADKVFGVVGGTCFGFCSSLHRLGIEIVWPARQALPGVAGLVAGARAGAAQTAAPDA